MIRTTRQLFLLHLSDPHFGPQHLFATSPTVTGDIPPDKGMPGLLEKLGADIEELSTTDGIAPGPAILCLTGDLTCSAKSGEFKQTRAFLDSLATRRVFGTPLGRERIFVVPGNHDVDYEKNDPEDRISEYLEFHNRFFGTRYRRSEHEELVTLHDRVDDLGALILTLNSSLYVQKGTPDEKRGNIDNAQLLRIENLLAAVPPEKRKSAIRVALLHHHPVLIPALAEPGRGYDAVHNSGALLAILRSYGFHLILHGHKHSPHTFTDDSQGAFISEYRRPLMIVAGGSVASKDLPGASRPKNTYNRIVVKYDPEADTTRVRVETRGLEMYKGDGQKHLPANWAWKTLAVSDRFFAAPSKARRPSTGSCVAYSKKTHDLDNTKRADRYQDLRGNIPIIEMRPSLDASQAYEARVWIVSHNRNDEDMPKTVQWLAGPKFPVVLVRAEDDPSFSTTFSYWGPMLVQAKLTFSTGEPAFGYVYAHLPAPEPEGAAV